MKSLKINKKTIISALLFLFFAFLPCGYSKHWLINESLVGGVLVDYLMPDIWLIDIIAFLIIILNFEKKLIKKEWPLILILFILAGFSQIPLVSMINLSRIVQALFLTKIIFNNKNDFKNLLLSGLGLAIGYTFLIALLQVLAQKNVFGWWFLGEPIFTKGGGGVKQVQIFNLSFVLPLGTLPHSNILGAFGLLGFYVFLKNLKTSWQKICLGLSLILVFASLSSVAYLGLLAIVLFNGKIINKLGKRRLIVILLLLTLFIIKPSSFYRRWQLTIISLKMFLKHPLFGVGLGTFVKSLAGLWQDEIRFRFLQPVHNVFLLLLSETGLIGFFCFGKILKDLLVKAFRRDRLVLVLFLLFALFDHFLLTATQGVYFLTFLALV